MPELYSYLHDKMKAETLEERLLFLLIIPREFVTAILLLNYTCSRVLSIHRVDDLRRIVSSGNFHYNRNEPGMAPIRNNVAKRADPTTPRDVSKLVCGFYCRDDYNLVAPATFIVDIAARLLS